MGARAHLACHTRTRTAHTPWCSTHIYGLRYISALSTNHLGLCAHSPARLHAKVEAMFLRLTFLAVRRCVASVVVSKSLSSRIVIVYIVRRVCVHVPMCRCRTCTWLHLKHQAKRLYSYKSVITQSSMSTSKTRLPRKWAQLGLCL